MWRYAVGIFAGLVCGIGIYFILFDKPAFLQGRLTAARFSGTLVGMDADAKTITLLIRNSFADTGAAAPVRFSYSDDTDWFSFGYFFEDGLMVRKKIAVETSRSLPEGTMVTLITTMDAGALTAANIAFLRRTDL